MGDYPTASCCAPISSGSFQRVQTSPVESHFTALLPSRQRAIGPDNCAIALRTFDSALFPGSHGTTAIYLISTSFSGSSGGSTTPSTTPNGGSSGSGSSNFVQNLQSQQNTNAIVSTIAGNSPVNVLASG